jgi:excisionase family DNA binding protein
MELGAALLPAINPAVTSQYGIEITNFTIENVSAPPEVEAAIDKRSSMSAIGNMNDYVKFQLANGLGKGEAGVAGTAAQLAAGFGIAQGLMGTMTNAGAATSTAQAPELMGIADAAKILGVTEADVQASIDSGGLKAKKIGSTYRITKAAIDAFLAE